MKPMIQRRLFILAAVILMAGCNRGDDDASGDTGSDSDINLDTDTDTNTDTDTDTDTNNDTDTDTDTDEDTSSDCTEEIDALIGEIHEGTKSCTVTVRLSHSNLEILGHQIFCAPYPQGMPVTIGEDEARAIVEADTGFGATGEMLNPYDTGDIDAYIFFEQPSDSGGVAAVNGYTGETAFGGSIELHHNGEIVYPDTWRDPKELGSNCPSSESFHPVEGYDLYLGDSLSNDDMRQVLEVVEQTGLLAAMWHNDYFFSAFVMLYTPSIKQFDPSNAEWIVLLNCGWLE